MLTPIPFDKWRPFSERIADRLADFAASRKAQRVINHCPNAHSLAWIEFPVAPHNEYAVHWELCVADVEAPKVRYEATCYVAASTLDANGAPRPTFEQGKRPVFAKGDVRNVESLYLAVLQAMTQMTPAVADPHTREVAEALLNGWKTPLSMEKPPTIPDTVTYEEMTTALWNALPHWHWVADTAEEVRNKRACVGTHACSAGTLRARIHRTNEAHWKVSFCYETPEPNPASWAFGSRSLLEPTDRRAANAPLMLAHRLWGLYAYYMPRRGGGRGGPPVDARFKETVASALYGSETATVVDPFAAPKR